MPSKTFRTSAALGCLPLHRPLLVAACACLVFLPLVTQSVRAQGRVLTDVVLTEYTDLSSGTELSRRLLSPLSADQLEQGAARLGKTLMAQSINLAAERFIVYVPANTPMAGYGLLVFVPPWQDARVPQGWAAALERRGVIFASAARSGNEESVLDRREPLALLAAYNLMQQYHVDSTRVYIGGFSGGARVALRLALGYPDVFHGVILNAGSDSVGDLQIPIPPKELFYQFQSQTHVVFVTGARDDFHRDLDSGSRLSLRRWCVFGMQDYAEPLAGHDVAGAGAFSWALDALMRNSRSDPKKLETCRATTEAELRGKMEQAESLMRSGHQEEAKRLLGKIDAQYGGLAAPRSVELAK